jgi:BMFP domain-containing protein YqiC
MQQNPFFDDLGKMASGAAGAMMDMRREMEQMGAQQIKQLLAKMDLVTREEFEVVKAMAEKARTENEALSARLDALESAKKPAAKKKA